MRSSFSPQSLFPDWPSRLGRRSQTQGDSPPGPGKRPGLRHRTLFAHGVSGSPDAASHLGRGQAMVRPGQMPGPGRGSLGAGPWLRAERGLSRKSSEWCWPPENRPGFWASLLTHPSFLIMASSQGRQPSPRRGQDWAEVPPHSHRMWPRFSPLPMLHVTKNRGGKKVGWGIPTVDRGRPQVRLGSDEKCKVGNLDGVWVLGLCRAPDRRLDIAVEAVTPHLLGCAFGGGSAAFPMSPRTLEDHQATRVIKTWLFSYQTGDRYVNNQT